MKLCPRVLNALFGTSPPVRGCGLKLAPIVETYAIYDVTPRAGVWIELSVGEDVKPSDLVTPRAGVWIETVCNNHALAEQLSHPPCGGVD